jgi:nitroreductase
MSGESMTQEELMTLFEAARWAPSSYNAQPWRFIYARRDTQHWQTFFDLLVEFNQSWAKDAAALVVVVARKTFEHNDKPSVTHAFDAGAAWENLAIQASSTGFVAHGMEGFDYEAAARIFNIPDGYVVLAMIAIGKPSKKEDLSEDLQAQEAPNDRRPLSEIVMEGEFKT